MHTHYLSTCIKQFRQYKSLAEKAIEQIDDSKLFIQFNDETNSISIIIKHLSGNMISRWTNFLTEDGEKVWRNRDEEFINNISNKIELMEIWDNGWNCLFETIEKLTAEDLEKIIFIRNEPQTVLEAINRQIAHYAYHVGQIVFLSKAFINEDWKTLSIPRKK